ncbi:unnamed protein product [Camellia sinensis]
MAVLGEEEDGGEDVGKEEMQRRDERVLKGCDGWEGTWETRGGFAMEENEGSDAMRGGKGSDESATNVNSFASLTRDVVSNLGKNNVMVILDNHISKPGWCCSKFDDSRFFGDQYFNPDLWIKGLTMMATLFKGTTNVVGMSLRNELRGPKQNVNDWYKYMQKGAEVVHAINPNVLVILSELTFDKDLSFLIKRPVSLSFAGKLVFEVHWYGFSDGLPWNPNHVCGRAMHQFMRKAGFVLEQGYPLFLSEFGVDLMGIYVIDNKYLNCLLGVAAELDFDWALWTLAGSYYLKEGVSGFDEVYGLLNWNWSEARNSSFLDRISGIQLPFQA